MFSFFRRNKKEVTDRKPIELKAIQYEPKIILAWAKAIEGDKVIQLGLKENGYPELFHVTEAIFLNQVSRDWLIANGYGQLMAMVNAAEGLTEASEWLATHKFELLFHIGRAVDHNPESWVWLKQFTTPDLFMLAKSIQFIKDQIEENHGDIHSMGKDL
jgi:hypothetical protein